MSEDAATVDDFTAIAEWASGSNTEDNQIVLPEILNRVSHAELRAASVQLLMRMFKAKRISQLHNSFNRIEQVLFEKAYEMSTQDLLVWRRQLITEFEALLVGDHAAAPAGGGGGGSTNIGINILNQGMLAGSAGVGNRDAFKDQQILDFVGHLDNAAEASALPPELRKILTEATSESEESSE